MIGSNYDAIARCTARRAVCTFSLLVTSFSCGSPLPPPAGSNTSTTKDPNDSTTASVPSRVRIYDPLSNSFLDQTGIVQCANGSMARVDVGKLDVQWDAATTVGSLRNAFGACYRETLRLEPTASGHSCLRLTVGPDGTVHLAETSAQLPVRLQDCILLSAGHATFPPTRSPGATVAVPLTFVRK
jgi:hypothetical protein